MDNSHVGVDFESFYSTRKTKANPIKINVQEMGNYNYAIATDIYLVSIYDGEQEYVGHPADFDWKSLKGRNLVSHNALFDKTLYEVLVAKKIISKIPQIGWWNCTANMSVYLRTGRALNSACKYLLGEEVSKDVRNGMNGLTVAQMKAADPTEAGFDSFYDEVVEYARKDGQLTWRLWQEHNHRWPEMEKRLSLLNIESCMKGLPIDTKYLKWGLNTLERKRHAAVDRLPWMNDPEIKNPAPQSKKHLADTCRAAGIDAPNSIAEDDAGYKAWKLKYAEDYTWVDDMKTIGGINLMIAKFKTIEMRVKRGGWMPFGLKYGGAHTMRWSGDQKLSVHGFEKEEVAGVNVRRCIHAPKGKKLIVADKCQIEARITPYLAGDWDTIDMISKGMSPYVVHGIKTMGLPPDFKETQPKMYALAKARVLALGFGCGAERFKDQAVDYGVLLSLNEAKRTVNDFRRTNPLITGLWDQLQEDLTISLNSGEDYEIELPSGRLLQYFNLSKVTSDWGLKVKAKTGRGDWDHKFLYGGLLTENLVQATARDVFAEDLLRLTDYGLDVLFHAHDEVCLCVDKSVTAKEVEELMGIVPDWLPGCPVGAEAKETDFYLKI